MLVAPLRYNYEPSPGQLAFHLDRGKVFERAVFAGTGGGKTYACCFELADLLVKEPAGVALIAGPDFPQMRLSVFESFKRLFGRPFPDGLEPYATWHARDRRLDWSTGWSWHFASMDDPTSVEGLPNGDVAWLNEARLIPRTLEPDGPWLNMKRRLRGPDNRPRHAILDTHSPGQDLVDYFEGGQLGRRVYRWSLEDAMRWRTIDSLSATRILADYPVGSARYKRVIQGLAARQEGLVYDDFLESRNLQALPKGIRPDYYSGGIDWGWDVTALVVNAYTGSRKWTVWEWGREHASLDQMLEAIQTAQLRFGALTWWGGHDRPDSAKELSDRGPDVRPCPTHRVMDGVGINQSALRAGEWLVSPDCPKVLNDVHNYVMDPAKGEPDKGSHDAHFLDAERYASMGERKGGVQRGGITW